MSLAFASRAEASGFLVARFGGEFGHPTADNPTAMYFNPAGLALGHGTRVYAEGLFAYRTAEYERPAGAIGTVLTAGETGPGTPIEAVDANSGEANLADPIVSPFIGIATDLGMPNLGIGLGFYVPFGGSATWDENDAYAGNTMYPGAVDGPQRWFTIEGSIRSSYITAAGAYRWPCIGLSVGLGLNIVYSQAETIRARNFDSTDDLVGPTGETKEGRSYIDVSGWTFSLGGGVIWEPTKDVWIGASYQTQPGFGAMRMSGIMKNQFGTGQASQEDIEFEQALPDVARLGARFRPSKSVELRAWGELVRWSSLEKQCILSPDGDCATNPDGSSAGSGILAVLPRQWEDAFGFRAGGSYFLNETIEAFAGAGYDSNAIPDETLEPTFIDADKLSFSLGGKFGLLDRALALTVTLTHVLYFERTVDMQPTRDYELPSKVPDAQGTYNQGVTFLNVAAEYRF